MEEGFWRIGLEREGWRVWRVEGGGIWRDWRLEGLEGGLEGGTVRVM